VHDVGLSPVQFASGLLEAAPDAIVGVNADGVIVLLNAQAERLFGYARDELLGQPLELLVPESTRDIHPRHRAAYIRDPRPRPMGAGMELTGRRRDGTEFPAEISLSAIDTSDGIVVAAAVRDVTSRKLIEQQLRDKNAELERLGRAKNAFLANMSHELRTPLNAIIGFTGTLLMQLPGPLNEEQERQLRTVQRSGKHLLSIINDLLDLARIESGAVELTLEPVDCGDVINGVVAALQPLADEKELALHTELPSGSRTTRSDSRALNQILINLVSNAIKFTDAGTVVVSLRPPVAGHGTTIAVSDTGPGIAPEDLDQLFGAFERGTGRAARSREGTGLGLHISQKLAELADIELRVTSTLGAGSTFTLEFGDHP
jgi:PAS domain S-box-containing protein